jgi:chromosome segregation ATPase
LHFFLRISCPNILIFITLLLTNEYGRYMASERTPTKKRIKRAEEGRDAWKVKAFERREENEKLKKALLTSNHNLEKLNIENEKLQEELSQTADKLAKTEKEIESLKKKHFR